MLSVRQGALDAMSVEQDREPLSSAHSQASAPAGAVFLSYASQDAEAARKICDALRAAGTEVWFDQSELRGGDAWDRQIRQKIHDCRLFIAVISAHTDARDEGYFRREWKLAVDRTHDMAEGKAFLVPIVIDGTTDRGASVPDKFRDLQWTRLPGGDTPPAFVQRVQRLLAPQASTSRPGVTGAPIPPAMRETVRASWRSRVALAGIIAVLGAVALYLLVARPWVSKQSVAPPATATAPAPAAPVNAAVFAPPPHSIAVLPFVNLSGDASQDYFSDGLTEELLNSLAEIEGLQVAARTSSFSFKEHPDIAAVAHKLNVAAVLEGSVRRSQHTVRVTAQLINAMTGFHSWSKTYDRDLGDVLKLQTEIATAVANALKVSLLGDVSAKIELGGTRNAAAFDAYLRGAKRHAGNIREFPAAIAAYTEAIRLDPNYALAFAGRSAAHSGYAVDGAIGVAIRDNIDNAQADARKAIALAPELAEGHAALARVLEDTLQFGPASEAYEHARALAPGNAEVLRLSGRFAVWMGQFDAGVTALRRAVVLDPLNPRSHTVLGQGLYSARRYKEAVAAAEEAIDLQPDYETAYGTRGVAHYGLGDLQDARASCEPKPGIWQTQVCLAVAYDKLGRHSDAEAVLAKMKAAYGDATAYQCAEIYAQWGNAAKALEWLDTAMRLRDAGLESTKTDPLLDPLRNEPRFQAIERELKFPN
jgi:TolB-like protein/Flp pilus assembly protein TadD